MSFQGLLLAVNTVVAVLSLLGAMVFLTTPREITRQLPPALSLAVLLAPVCSTLNVLFGGALLGWQKWGFYGLVGTTLLMSWVNLAAGGGARGCTGLIGASRPDP
jgi:hypothetical protein